MRYLILLLTISLLWGCNQPSTVKKDGAEELSRFFEAYYEEYLRLFPLQATTLGDNRYNDQLNIAFTESFRDSLRSFYTRYLQGINRFDTADLDENDRISHQIFRYEMEMQLEELSLPLHMMPFHQFWGLQLDMGQLGSGNGSQPFKTAADYENWNRRAARFQAWADSAIIYFRKGMEEGYVLPRSLVVKMIPQMRDLSRRGSESIFLGPVKMLPASLKNDSTRIQTELEAVINNHLSPAYTRLADFLEKEYLPRSRSTSGINALPGGDSLYRFLVKQWTTTHQRPEEIYATGLAEVSRIRGEMEKVRNQVGFRGDLNAFFNFMRDDPRFMPFRTPEQVLQAYRDIQQKIDPHVDKMFGNKPRTRFEIRRTEAFREASASAEYQQGTPDGSRPGIFYVPIIDAATYNTTSGMESLFLHEAIPGHHFQISLQQENESLPRFRRFAWYGAFGEGWALYTESLGKELGLYTDPYQYMGALGDEIHRAIRLVVDVALHTGKMSREEAIRYMMDNEAISEQGATAEIERYMAIPGQALSYKIGALKIAALRQQYQQELGDKFNLSAFHDELLKDGLMPLAVLEQKMNRWAASVK